MVSRQSTITEDIKQRPKGERRSRERGARRGEKDEKGEKDHRRKNVHRQTSENERDVIRNSWGFVYDLDGELPQFYLADEKGTFWLNRKGRGIHRKNNSPIFDHIMNDKLFKLKQEIMEFKDGGKDKNIEDIIITIEPIEEDVFVDGILLRNKTVIKDGQCDITFKKFNYRLKFQAFVDTTNHPELSCIGPKYRYINLLGRGGFAFVHKGFNVTDETFCAIKSARFGNKDAELEKENSILSKVQHTHIIKCLDFVEVGNKQFLITELSTGGSLEFRIRKGDEITEVFAKRIFTQLFSAVGYLHHRKILHRDLKPANIVLSKPNDETCAAKVIDFGLACLTTDEDMNNYIVGSYHYIAPEILTKKLRKSAETPYTEKVDVWGLGVCLFEALNKCLPFKYNEDLKKYRQTLMLGRDSYQPMESYQNLSKGTKYILESCLHINEKRRPLAQLLMKYPWVLTDTP